MSTEEITGLIYTSLGALAGAITSLFYRSWEGMSAKQMAFAVFVGTTFAFFVGPLLFRNITDMRIAGGLFYLLATGANALIPILVKRLGTVAGAMLGSGVNGSPKP